MATGYRRWMKDALLAIGRPEYEGDFKHALERWAGRLLADLRLAEAENEKIALDDVRGAIAQNLGVTPGEEGEG